MTTCTSRAAWLNLLRRLHFYIGLFIGPFIFVAALTGTLYVATPQLEKLALSRRAAWPCRGDSAAAQRPDCGGRRSDPGQSAAAGGASGVCVGRDHAHYVCRSGSRRVGIPGYFVDPIALRVKGDMTVYGTSGILPLRQWIDYAHRSLLLGDSGRLYSELAASWMWWPRSEALPCGR